MSNWTHTIYLKFADETTARAVALALGADFPVDGSVPIGDDNYALAAPIVEYSVRPAYGVVSGVPTVTNAGTVRAGYWAMAKFNLGTTEGAAAYGQLQAQMAGAIQTLLDPCNTFAGDA